MDEPTNGLDAASNQNLVAIIKEMAQNGCTFLISSHEWGIIEKCCNRLGMLFNGSIKKELHTSNDMQDKQMPAIQIKTISPLKEEIFEKMEEITSFRKIDEYTWRLTFPSQQSINALQHLLIKKNISLQEWVEINPLQEWKNLYNQWIKEENANAESNIS
ncbi:hypothetical protein J9303_08975 [Bacillaceae bacterium Marseille-Q3522]|nr:hypothetical protein [Bacillaceae bacterium Marseille-Q3522]